MELEKEKKQFKKRQSKKQTIKKEQILKGSRTFRTVPGMAFYVTYLLYNNLLYIL